MKKQINKNPLKVIPGSQNVSAVERAFNHLRSVKYKEFLSTATPEEFESYKRKLFRAVHLAENKGRLAGIYAQSEPKSVYQAVSRVNTLQSLERQIDTTDPFAPTQEEVDTLVADFIGAVAESFPPIFDAEPEDGFGIPDDALFLGHTARSNCPVFFGWGGRFLIRSNTKARERDGLPPELEGYSGNELRLKEHGWRLDPQTGWAKKAKN